MRSYLYLIFKVGFYQKFSLPSRKCIPPFDFFWIIHVVYVSFLLRLTNINPFAHYLQYDSVLSLPISLQSDLVASRYIGDAKRHRLGLLPDPRCKFVVLSNIFNALAAEIFAFAGSPALKFGDTSNTRWSTSSRWTLSR